MGIIVVDICEGSFILQVKIEEIIENEFPEVAVIQNNCLSFCGMCARSPFAIVNGKRVFANTFEECVEKIKKQIELELAQFS